MPDMHGYLLCQPNGGDSPVATTHCLRNHPGDAKDLSRMSGTLEEGTPKNQLGGFSAIDFDTESNSWFVLSDRGPADGATSYECAASIHDGNRSRKGKPPS